MNLELSGLTAGEIEELKEMQLNPDEAFAKMKNLKQTTNIEELKKIIDYTTHLLNKARITKQQTVTTKLLAHYLLLQREMKILKAGYEVYVHSEDIKTLINCTKDRVIKAICLSDYVREVPDEAVVHIEATKDIFTDFIVVYTDYTGKEEKRIVKEERKKDPILFGSFMDASSDVLLNRLYYLCDWEDEYCDLTLDKLVDVFQKNNMDSPLKYIHIPVDVEEIKKEINEMSETNRLPEFSYKQKVKPKSIFRRIINKLSGKNNE